MAMNIVRFDDAGTPRWGLVVGDQVQTLDLEAGSTATLMTRGIEVARAAAANPAPDRELASLQLLCPVTGGEPLQPTFDSHSVCTQTGHVTLYR